MRLRIADTHMKAKNEDPCLTCMEKPEPNPLMVDDP